MSEPRVLANVTAVAIGGRGLLLIGAPGSGKSSLAMSLIDRGAMLIGDDAITLSRSDKIVTLAPAPNTRGMLELRGVGIINLPTGTAPLALVLDLDTTPQRLPDVIATRNIHGIAFPCLPFDATDQIAVLRAEQALVMHGVTF